MLLNISKAGSAKGKAPHLEASALILFFSLDRPAWRKKLAAKVSPGGAVPAHGPACESRKALDRTWLPRCFSETIFLQLEKVPLPP